jgi:rod shape determining protein RodA
MGVIRAEPARVTDWAAKSVGAVWRAFDLQLVTYAGLLAAIGLVMAYTNSVENGKLTLETQTVFTRGLMWAGIAVVIFIVATAFDYRWLKTLSWPIYGLQLALLVLTLAIGDGVGNSARWIALGPFTFQFSELAKIFMIIVLANYLSARQGRLDSLSSILGACALVLPPLALVALQPDLGTSLVFAAILAGMLWMSGASLKWLAALAGVIAPCPRLTYILTTIRSSGFLFLDADPDIKAHASSRRRSRWAPGAGWARASRTGRRPRATSCRSRRRTSCSRSSPRSWDSSAASSSSPCSSCCCGGSSRPAGVRGIRSARCSLPGWRR